MAGGCCTADPGGKPSAGVPLLTARVVGGGSPSQASETIMSDAYRRRLLTLCGTLMEADPDEGISTDELMTASGLNSEDVRGALHSLESLGIASNDTALTAFVHAGVERSSLRRFEEATALETAFVDLLRELAPDMEKGDSSTLHLRVATQRLKDGGHGYALPERLRRIVRSIAADGRGEGGAGGSLSVRGRDAETLHVTLQREWGALVRTAELRRSGAKRLLDHLLRSLPPRSRGTDLLVETTMGKLLAELQSDLTLRSEVRSPDKLMDRTLLWLHEQEIIRLNKGLAVFRPAMTIRLKPERRGFIEADFRPLRMHYDEQTLQIHVMAEYAQQGLGSMTDAVRLAMDYFNLPEKEFLGRWLPDRAREVSRQTTPESWRTIVEDLRNPAQRRIVAEDAEQPNVLVLAGPGSGKTRVLVHRIAYLIRVRRENPRSILALAYNRHAAAEIRRRLQVLIGDDARGVIVLTCHALAMRLVGASFSGRADRLDAGQFQEVLGQAASLLRGEGLPTDEADEFRSRLLSGFRWILVDEYQDIGPDQYALISALAGRALADEDEKLSLFAVGDDDQNVYAFNGSSVEFIRRFEADYGARPAFLTDNYRSTRHIIEASNVVIESSQSRMKTEHPIQINGARSKEPPGGEWSLRDPLAHGRVQIMDVGETPISQAQAVVAELKRLSSLDPNWNWASCAVIAREWNYLDPVRNLCELEDIPVQMANEEFSGVWHLRETRCLRDWVRGRESKLVKAEDLVSWLTTEWAQESRRRQRGLMLLTAHRAKGLEFDHVVVLDGGWNRVRRGEDTDSPRRLYYVAMTRARQTLTLARFPGPHPLLDVLVDEPSVLLRNRSALSSTTPRELSRRYRRLGLRDVFLSYAGYQGTNNPVHRAIARLSAGDILQVRAETNRWELVDRQGTVV